MILNNHQFLAYVVHGSHFSGLTKFTDFSPTFPVSGGLNKRQSNICAGETQFSKYTLFCINIRLFLWRQLSSITKLDSDIFWFVFFITS